MCCEMSQLIEPENPSGGWELKATSCICKSILKEENEVPLKSQHGPAVALDLRTFDVACVTHSFIL